MTRPITVAVVHDRYQQLGGEDVAAANDIALLQDRGHHVVYYERHNDEIANLGPFGRARLAAGTVWSSSSSQALGRLVDTAKPDVVHVHNTFPLLSPSIYRAATRRGVPVVQSVHNYRLSCPTGQFVRDGHICHDCAGRRLALPAVQHACYRDSRLETGVVAAMLATHRALRSWDHVSMFLPVSEYMRQRLVAFGAFPADRAIVRYNHVSPDPGKRPEGSDSGYVVFVGRISVEKGVDVLVRAAAMVRDVPVRIVGDGPKRPEVERLARELGATNVSFLGHLPRPAAMDVVRGARCIALTSTWEEPSGLVLIEAAALGVAAIGTNVGGAPEAIGPGAGVLLEPRDVPALASALRDAGGDPAGWRARGVAARRYFEQQFSADRAYDVLCAAYARVGVQLG